MIKLHEGPQLVLHDDVLAPVSQHPEIDLAVAKQQTLSYQVLQAHNHSGDMENLQIRFDEMGVYDNTYVGILQTAVASGLQKFPMPTVFTNCHNCLAAVGGTINTDVHKYAETACHKFGGIFVPPHEAVIHQYMREMLIKSGDMAIVSDSHTRYGTQGSVSIGEGGPELAKAMIGKLYEIKYPKVIAVLLHGSPKPWVGPMDVALTLIGATFKNKFVKNAVLEFIGPGVHSMSMDFRNGIDTMTTESACLSSIWETDDVVKEYFEIHKRPQDYKKMQPGDAALYDAVVEIDLDTVEPMIALPYHPSNAFPLREVIAEPETEIQYGPAIKDWPEMVALTDNLLLQVASVIRDDVTTTDELIPSGETASYRSNPYKISEFTLQRKDPQYVPNAKAAQAFEKARLAGDAATAQKFYSVLHAVGINADDPAELSQLMKSTGLGSVLYAKRPGDGSAREYAASCQKVLGGLANICIDYATKRYRSNCVNWGMLPFTYPDENIDLAVGEYVWLPGIRQAVADGATEVAATVISADGKTTREMKLELKDVTESEKKILLAGSMINSYREDMGL